MVTISLLDSLMFFPQHRAAGEICKHRASADRTNSLPDSAYEGDEHEEITQKYGLVKKLVPRGDRSYTTGRTRFLFGSVLLVAFAGYLLFV